ncbi:hypothetical protein TraAM80_09357 [Trypanosoma rangeli]|uniref:Uncharacterized protein n=1 Tax=Trypanosoma rangeli TaxID=5698 RepID=A0A3R7MYU6_TRYRA|nr:uncharacterized protein TraAM80_09357 [Trypanosoma rangeli]RNE97350.1 hypothetical protein TraAM80_09357 [Trypanosoma rangeli]|eukprot:RNE97350.1 hypothetical protein TraAM80_09357 [Trypanosoma rangeli]
MSSQKAHQPLFVLKQHSSAVMTCAIDEQQVFTRLLLSGDGDGVVKLWDLELHVPLLSFHAVNRVSSSADTNNQQGTTPAFFTNTSVLKVGFLTFQAMNASASEEGESVCFYTQCRNQHVYVWRAVLCCDDDDDIEELDSTKIEGTSVELLHTINVPQHGFCTVPCVAVSCRELQLAIPHDNDGIISLWSIGLVDRDATNCAQHLHVSCFKSFSASGAGTRCGMIMCINFRDGTHLAVAFESGHVTLNNICGERLAIIRAFPETALTCVWFGDSLLSSSADGQLHCYVVLNQKGTGPDTPFSEADNAMSLAIRWEASLRKGLGSVALQRHLAVVGSWDRTMRLYDEGSGRVVSILTFHSGTVNEIAVFPASLAKHASFGYDVRRPRWCGAANAKTEQEEDSVYLFASASGDFTIAIWRLDFRMLRAAKVSAV